MADNFSRTLLSLDAERRRSRSGTVVLLTLLLLAWAIWFFYSSLSVFVVSTNASLEAVQSGHRVSAPVGGRVVSSSLELGRRVKKGEVLVTLDAEKESLTILGETSRLEGLKKQLASLLDESKSTEGELQAASARASATLDETQERLEVARMAMELARRDAERLGRLHTQGLVSDADVGRVESELAQRAGEYLAIRQSLGRLSWDGLAQRGALLARLDRLAYEGADTRGQLETGQRAVDRLRSEAEDRVVRAPCAGILGEVLTLSPGAMVQESAELGTVVPDGTTRVVAYFPVATALGRLTAGQRARVLLDGFPWIEFGSLAARVAAVGAEGRDGSVRAELSFHDDTGGKRASLYQHGLTCTVEVEVERVSPARLVLRKAGVSLDATRSAQIRPLESTPQGRTPLR